MAGGQSSKRHSSMLTVVGRNWKWLLVLVVIYLFFCYLQNIAYFRKAIDFICNSFVDTPEYNHQNLQCFPVLCFVSDIFSILAFSGKVNTGRIMYFYWFWISFLSRPLLNQRSSWSTFAPILRLMNNVQQTWFLPLLFRYAKHLLQKLNFMKSTL